MSRIDYDVLTLADARRKIAELSNLLIISSDQKRKLVAENARLTKQVADLTAACTLLQAEAERRGDRVAELEIALAVSQGQGAGGPQMPQERVSASPSCREAPERSGGDSGAAIGISDNTAGEPPLADSAIPRLWQSSGGRYFWKLDTRGWYWHARQQGWHRVETMYEDDLPTDMSDTEYSEWFVNSAVVDGVRIGPKLDRR